MLKGMTTLVNRQTIVVGVDGSPSSFEAACWAGAVADRLGAPLLVASVIPEPGYYFSGDAMMSYPVSEELVAATTSNVDDARELVQRRYPGVAIDTEILAGRADTALIENADHARMMVVGSRGKGSINSLLIGSTALRIANHASCPVVVWRGEPGQPIPLHLPVIVGVDGSELSEHAVASAFELAGLFAVPLVAVHTWTTSLQGPTTDESERALLSECVSGWAEKYPDVEVTQVAEEGNAAAMLIELAATAQLVVVGSHGRNRLAAALLGSTSQNLLHHVSSPLMICRGR